MYITKNSVSTHSQQHIVISAVHTPVVMWLTALFYNYLAMLQLLLQQSLKNCIAYKQVYAVTIIELVDAYLSVFT